MKANTFLSLFAHATFGSAQILLGTAATFGALSEDSITNTGPTAITGNIGTTGSSIIGFPPGAYTGTEYIATAATTPYNDAQTAYNQVAALTGAIPLTGDLSGVSLAPGTYSFSSSASLSTGAVLTLVGTGSSSDAWNFQIATTLITGSGSSIVLTNGGQACHVFWQVGTSATLGTGSTFIGTILAAASVTADTDAVSSGGLFALGGSVTLDSNTVAIASCLVASSSSTSTSHISTTSSKSSSVAATSHTTTSSSSASKSSSSTTTSHSSASSSSVHSTTSTTSSSVKPMTSTTSLSVKPTTTSSSSSKPTTSSSKPTSSSASKTSSTSSSSKASSTSSKSSSTSSSSKTTTSTSSKPTTSLSSSKSATTTTKTTTAKTTTSTSATCPCATSVVTVYSGICSSQLVTSTLRSTSTVYVTASCSSV